MKDIVIPFAGEEITLTGSGLLWIEKYKLLCAADIHFEKATFFSRFATFLPPYDSDETLARLEKALLQYRPDIFIALGDSFHDRDAGDRMPKKQIEQLNNLVKQIKYWHWITGNHDPTISNRILGLRSVEFQFNTITFRHELKSSAVNAEISGHYHPKATIHVKGNRITAPCFLLNTIEPKRLILPAFGALTGGLDIDSTILRKHMPIYERQIYMIKNGFIFKG